MRRPALISHLLLAGLTTGDLLAQTPQPTARTARPSAGNAYLEQAVAAFEKTPGLRVASWGFVALDARTGQVLASRSPDRSLAPASTQKLLTTAAALAILGPEYRVKTRLYTRGRVSGDTLYGMVALSGMGDPALGTDRFGPAYTTNAVHARWQQAVRKRGIRHILGSIGGVGTPTILPPYTPGGYSFADMGTYFGAQVSDFTFGENYDSVIFKTGAPGTPAQIIRYPGIQNKELVVNRVKAGPSGSGDQTYLYETPNATVYQGTLPPNRDRFAVKVSLTTGLNEKAIFELANALNGMMVEDVLTMANQPLDPKKDILIDELESPTVAEIVRETNLHSLNLHAETLLRWMGHKESGEGTLDAGLAVLKAYWRSKGLPADGMMLTDGSGLSQSNSLSPRHQAMALRVMLSDPTISGPLRVSLPILGQTGTLKTLGADTPAAGRLRAKSGTLTRVLCYTGTYTERSGREVVFSVMVNRYSGTFEDMRRAMGTLLVTMGSQ